MSFFKKLGKAVGSVVKTIGKTALSVAKSTVAGVASTIPVIGSGLADGINNIGVKQEVVQQAQETAQAIAQQQPTVQNVAANAGYPVQSTTFPNGSNATDLGTVQISAPKTQLIPVNTDFNLDWKKGTISTSSTQGTDSKLLLYGLLGLGAIMVLNKK